MAAAAAGAVLVGLFTGGAVSGGEPVASAEPAPLESVSVAEQLGITADPTASVQERLAPLGEQVASRSQRETAQAEARKARYEANKAELERRAEAARKEAARKEAARKEAARQEAARKEAARKEAARKEAARKEAARKEAARKEAAKQEAASAPAPASAGAPASAAAAPAAAPSGSYQQYALSKLGGDRSQFSCLESLWGKESGWNPNAQNPTSSAYGIAQFLDSTWAGTGIAKTSDGYRQIDAGLVYINKRYGSPCGAWSHSQANNWY